MKPTEDVGLTSFAWSCIMDSRRVGDLKVVFEASAYLQHRA